MATSLWEAAEEFRLLSRRVEEAGDLLVRAGEALSEYAEDAGAPVDDLGRKAHVASDEIARATEDLVRAVG